VTSLPEETRVARIAQYQVLTDPPRRDLIALADVAAQVAGVPMATINLITDTEQHQVATVGFEPSICAREDSMCNAVFQHGGPVVVPDAREDPRFRDNPFVNGALGEVRFYATYPLSTPQGLPIGTLCVFDEEPRAINAHQRQALASLAERVVDLLELELRSRELELRTEELDATVDDLCRTQEELKRSNDMLTAFAGQVSHDLSNPLAAIALALELLEVDRGHDPRASALLTRATSGVRRMRLLIEDLLAFARLGGELVRVEVDLAEVVDEVRDDLATALAGATVEVGELPTVVGDPVQLRAVVQNLVANAAKFTRPGEPAHIAIGALRDGDCWRIEVSDRGTGIPAEQRHRVFEPLARVDTSVEGSGIGLATCRRIVAAHGGRIGLDESPSGGTLAWFELPA
jgi:signal transduction histidine kinase